MPNEHIGVIVFVIGNHTAPLYNPVSYNVYERLLGMDLTPWTDRQLDIRLKGKKAGTESRSKEGFGRVPGTKPSHALTDYVGEYEHPAYGALKITMKGDRLTVKLNGEEVISNAQLPGVPPEGPIAIQHHGSWDAKNNRWAGPPSLVQCKNIYIKELK